MAFVHVAKKLGVEVTVPITGTHCSNDGTQEKQDVQESSGTKEKSDYFKYIKVYKTKWSSEFSALLGGLMRCTICACR